MDLMPGKPGQGTGEIPPPERMPRPLITWGILAATVQSLRDNFKNAMPRLDLDSLEIDIASPLRVQSFPLLQVGLNNIDIEATGFHPQDILFLGEDEDSPYRKLVLRSTGQISLTVYSEAALEAVSIMDHLTQLYLLQYLYEDSFFWPATNREYIAMNLQPGKMSWGAITEGNYSDARDTPDTLYTVSCSYGFMAEHSVPYELARVSALEVEAIPRPPLSASLP